MVFLHSQFIEHTQQVYLGASDNLLQSNKMDVFSCQKQSSSPAEEKIVRPLADFPPGVWGDFFISHTPAPLALESSARIEELKTEVKAMFKDSINDVLANILRLVDDVQRLGLERHFQEEIDDTLRRIHNDDEHTDDLCTVALRFRLLRQQGYNVPAGVFSKFRDEEEGKFKKELSCEAKGLLYLYEASLLGTRDENILEEAMDFTKGHMEHLMTQTDNKYLAAEMKRTLEMPYYRYMRRLAARHFIESYEGKETSSYVLLELAKLDFTIVQSLHQAEIKKLSIWWNELGLSEGLSFARKRVVECYYWSMGVHWEPQYSEGRVLLAKLINLMTVVDDMFDAYGTLEELQQFNDTLQRWDLQDMDRLPENMRAFVVFFSGIVKEIEDKVIQNGRLHQWHYFIKAFQDYVNGYLAEAIWVNEGYTPTLEEYLHTSLISSGYTLLLCVPPLVNGEDLTTDILEWLLKMPKIVRASALIGRLMDDLVTYKFEQERKHVASSVQCYAEEHGVSEEKACTVLNKMFTDAWKDMNKVWLDDQCQSKKYFNMLAINYSRMMETMYKYEDSFTNPSGEMKKNIASLLVHQI